MPNFLHLVETISRYWGAWCVGFVMGAYWGTHVRTDEPRTGLQVMQKEER
jgi:hypothetical protein